MTSARYADSIITRGYTSRCSSRAPAPRWARAAATTTSWHASAGRCPRWAWRSTSTRSWRRCPSRERPPQGGARQGAPARAHARAVQEDRCARGSRGGPREPPARRTVRGRRARVPAREARSEEHTSELQSRLHLVCRLLLEKKKKKP